MWSGMTVNVYVTVTCNPLVSGVQLKVIHILNKPEAFSRTFLSVCMTFNTEIKRKSVRYELRQIFKVSINPFQANNLYVYTS